LKEVGWEERVEERREGLEAAAMKPRKGGEGLRGRVQNSG